MSIKYFLLSVVLVVSSFAAGAYTVSHCPVCQKCPLLQNTCTCKGCHCGDGECCTCSKKCNCVSCPGKSGCSLHLNCK